MVAAVVASALGLLLNVFAIISVVQELWAVNKAKKGARKKGAPATNADARRSREALRQFLKAQKANGAPATGGPAAAGLRQRRGGGGDDDGI